jgi:hypothetical protein
VQQDTDGKIESTSNVGRNGNQGKNRKEQQEEYWINHTQQLCRWEQMLAAQANIMISSSTRGIRNSNTK